MLVLGKNFSMVCTVAMTEKNGSWRWDLLPVAWSSPFVNALASQHRTRPLVLVGQRALGTVAREQLIYVVETSSGETDCWTLVPTGRNLKPVSLFWRLHPRSVINSNPTQHSVSDHYL